MRGAALDWFQLTFPRTVDAKQVTVALAALNGLSTPARRDPLVLQVVAHDHRIEHFLAVPTERAAAASQQVTAALPGTSLAAASRPAFSRTPAWRLWLSSSRRPLDMANAEPVSRALLTAFAGVRMDEVVVVQWLLGPVRRPIAVGTYHPPVLGESWATAIGTAPFVPPVNLDSEARKALRDKQGAPGWRAVGRIAVLAASRPRTLQLLGRVTGALRTAQGPGAALGVKPTSPGAVTGVRLPLRWPLAVNVNELAGLIAWPIGDTTGLPVQRRNARLLPVPRDVPTVGRVLATTPDGRPLALNPPDSNMHLLVTGPTGAGKSTFALNAILGDIAAERAVIVVDPKGDLVSDVLQRMPASRAGDVVVLDASDRTPVGLNPLAGTASPELVADQLLGILARTYRDSWGPRTADVLHAALLTLARTPGMTLPALPLLLTDAAFRRRLVGRMDDPLGVEPFWAWYEGLSDEQRAQVIAPTLNKIRPFLMRPQLRAVLGQPQPRFDMRHVFTDRKVLLVNLAQGLLGSEGAALLGTLVLQLFWQQARRRSEITPAKRHPVFVYLDEVRALLNLPVDIGDMLTTARGLGVAFALLAQHLDQFPTELRATVLANARSRMVFQTGARDAAELAKGHPELEPDDISGLPAYEAYLQLVVNGRVTPYISGRSQPAPPVTSNEQALRQHSRQRYGVPRERVEAELRQLIEPYRPGDSVVGSRRRPA
jgi:hypothetical protein